jgi:hypothetical protein
MGYKTLHNLKAILMMSVKEVTGKKLMGESTKKKENNLNCFIVA